MARGNRGGYTALMTRTSVTRTSVILTATLAVSASIVTAAPAPKRETVRIQKTERIASGAAGEHCAKLAAGQVARYRFESDVPVDFNIHRYRGKEVIYAVQHEQVTGTEFVDFKPDTEAEWCWMWTNKNVATARVGYTMFVAQVKRAKK